MRKGNKKQWSQRKHSKRQPTHGQKTTKCVHEHRKLNAQACIHGGILRPTPNEMLTSWSGGSLTNLNNLGRLPKGSYFNILLLLTATARHSDFNAAIALLCFIWLSSFFVIFPLVLSNFCHHSFCWAIDGKNIFCLSFGVFRHILP